RSYAALGVVVGLGVLTKYSFALFLIGLLAAGLSLPQTRSRILSPRLLFSIAVALIIAAPHAVWLAGSFSALQDVIVYKLEIDADTAWLVGVGQGLLSLGRALFAFLSPWWFVVLLVFPAAFRHRPVPQRHSPVAALLGRSFAVILAVMILMVLAGGVTHFRGNYLFLLILAPLWVFARIPAEAQPGGRRKAYTAVVLGAAILAVGTLAAKPIVDPQRCRKCQELVPYETLALELATHGFKGGTLYATWYPLPLAGNLALHLDGARAISSKFPNIRPKRAEPSGQCLLIWVPPEQGGLNTRTLRILAFQVFDAEVPEDTPVTRLEIPIDGASDKKILVDFMLLDPSNGECR
ncbi:MAG: glycosyltransferase family 39 protein, partial [Rhodospirillales bacterium]|nr:glycosyltransferase family 39 protein [Rhodospirillales bacterium]